MQRNLQGNCNTPPVIPQSIIKQSDIPLPCISGQLIPNGLESFRVPNVVKNRLPHGVKQFRRIVVCPGGGKATCRHVPEQQRRVRLFVHVLYKPKRMLRRVPQVLNRLFVVAHLGIVHCLIFVNIVQMCVEKAEIAIFKHEMEKRACRAKPPASRSCKHIRPNQASHSCRRSQPPETAPDRIPFSAFSHSVCRRR